jgi:histidine triad (HIT) family protein
MDCIFCKISNGEIPVNLVYQDDKVIAFHDINPAAPVHILIVPREHIVSLLDVDDDKSTIIAHAFKVAKLLAIENKLSENGFRIVNNCGDDGGQTVQHIHFHLLGGRNMTWPPG